MVKNLNEDYFLWKRFIEGSDDAFGILYDEYADSLFRYGMHFSRDKDYIKDCIHDLFLDLYKYRHNLSMTDSIRFYLLRSLRRKINQNQNKIIQLNYNKDISLSNENQSLPFEESLIVSEIEVENSRVLMKAMKNLTDRQREGLSLKFEHNLSYPEIAKLLDMTVESARTSIYRALKTLRKSIEDDKSSIYLLIYLSRCSLSDI
jgi:RNA polymerase sigma factor (sigma-70 family)